MAKSRRRSRKMKRGGENTFMDESSSSSSSLSSSSHLSPSSSLSSVTMGGRRRHRRGRRGGAATPAVPTAPPATTPAAPAAPAVPSMTPASTLTKPPVVPAKGGRRRKGSRSRGRSRRGGDGGSDWVLKNFGDSNTQWDNTFTNAGLAQQGNLLPTVAGAPAVLANNIPQSSLAANAGPMKGGRRSRRGGYWMNVLNQALVPFGLVGLQNRFSKRIGRSNANRTHKMRRH